MIQGPTGVDEKCFDSLHDITARSFTRSLVPQYPQLFYPGNWNRLRIMREGSRVVSLVGMTVQDASIYGCALRVACIGSVCTLEEHRNKGYATKLFHDAIRMAREEEVDLMITSGGRSIYMNAGSARVGKGMRVLMSVSSQPRLLEGVTVKRVEAEAIPLLSKIYASEPVHFLRDPDTWHRAFACRFVMDKTAHAYLALLKGVPVGYVLIHAPRKEKDTASVVEFAGDRSCLVDAFRLVAQKHHLAKASFYVCGWDEPLMGLARRLRLKSEPSNVSGVYLVTRFGPLMENLRPWFRRTLGDRELFFKESRQGFSFSSGGATFLVKDRADVAKVLWGTCDDLRIPRPRQKRLAGLLDEIFPLPELWYGINYV